MATGEVGVVCAIGDNRSSMVPSRVAEDVYPMGGVAVVVENDLASLRKVCEFIPCVVMSSHNVNSYSYCFAIPDQGSSIAMLMIRMTVQTERAAWFFAD